MNPVVDGEGFTQTADHTHYATVQLSNDRYFTNGDINTFDQTANAGNFEADIQTGALLYSAVAPEFVSNKVFEDNLINEPSDIAPSYERVATSFGVVTAALNNAAREWVPGVSYAADQVLLYTGGPVLEVWQVGSVPIISVTGTPTEYAAANPGAIVQVDFPSGEELGIDYLTTSNIPTVPSELVAGQDYAISVTNLTDTDLQNAYRLEIDNSIITGTAVDINRGVEVGETNYFYFTLTQPQINTIANNFGNSGRAALEVDLSFRPESNPIVVRIRDSITTDINHNTRYTFTSTGNGVLSITPSDTGRTQDLTVSNSGCLLYTSPSPRDS